MNEALEYICANPDKILSDFVDMIWMLHNRSENDKDVVIVPDGRIDLLFSQSSAIPLRVALFGLETQWEKTTIASGTLIFAVSFKPLGAEYLLNKSVADLKDNLELLPANYMEVTLGDLTDFKMFCKKISESLIKLIPEKIDKRKQKLFHLIDDSDGSLTVKELKEKIFWNSRQINRYFKRQFGISLKKYCNVIRFRNSIRQPKAGKLIPTAAFTDQSHFIREIKRFAGVSPKEINKEKDRFIQFSKR